MNTQPLAIIIVFPTFVQRLASVKWKFWTIGFQDVVRFFTAIKKALPAMESHSCPSQLANDHPILEHQIEARPLWKPMHMQPLYSGSDYHGSGVDEKLFANGLCLPSGSDMSDEQQEEVIGLIADCIAGR